MNLQVIDPHKFDDWNLLAANIAYICWAVVLLIVLGYFIRLATNGDNKDKYDFINKYEISVLWIATIVIITGSGFFFNSTIIELKTIMIFVRLFLTIMMGIITAVIIQNLLKFYYPFYIEKRLKVLRYKPRVSPKTGKPMKLLSEDEEDVHLDAGMIAEENVFSIDYDVWIDEKTKEVKIEKYPGHLTALRCNNCGFYTMRVVKEEIVEKYEDGSPKELLKNYQCSYCKNKRATQFNISTKEADDYKSVKPKSTKSPRNVELVKIEIRAGHKGNKFYEFQSIEEAQAFLEAFDFDKLA